MALDIASSVLEYLNEIMLNKTKFSEIEILKPSMELQKKYS